MTTIALHSDLHLELQTAPINWLKEAPDILILDGDITRIDQAKTLLIGLAERHPQHANSLRFGQP